MLVTVSPHLVQPLRAFGRRVLAPRRARGGGHRGRDAGRRRRGAGDRGRRRVGAAAGVGDVGGTARGSTGVGAGWRSSGSRRATLADARAACRGRLPRVRARRATGRPLLIKVYGRDAYDRQLLARRVAAGLVPAAWAVLAARPARGGRARGVRDACWRRAAAWRRARSRRRGRRPTHDALLVLRGEASPLGAGPQLDEAWAALARLARAADRPSADRADDRGRRRRRVGFVDFGVAAVGPDEHQLGTDRAQLLVTTASIAGRGARARRRRSRRARPPRASPRCCPTCRPRRSRRRCGGC